MKTMLWKNGRGTTTEVAIFPAQSSLASGDFTWRISAAEMSEPVTFSTFPGFDRILTAWSGHSLALDTNGISKVVAPMMPTSFSGSAKVECTPNGVVNDLGIIFNSNAVKAEMRLIDQNRIELDRGVHILFSIVQLVRKYF